MILQLISYFSGSLLLTYFGAAFYMSRKLPLYSDELNEQTDKNERSENQSFISVIIPFRNEAENLPGLLMAIDKINYHRFEVVFVDDHSVDNSLQSVQAFCGKNSKYKVLELKQGKGKRAAQRMAVSEINGGITAFTDADCLPCDNWLEKIDKAFQNPSVQFYIGMLKLKEAIGILPRFFELEFYALLFSGAAMAKAGQAIYCNAANMAVRSVALRAFYTNEKIKSASGDDVFLLHFIKKQFGAKAIFTGALEQGTVIADVPGTLRAFVKQRMRWGGKTKFYTDKASILTAAYIFLVNVSVLAALLLFTVSGGVVLLFPFAVKLFADFLLFKRGLSLVNRTNLLKYLPLFEFMYIIYLPVTALLSVSVPVAWKNRRK